MPPASSTWLRPRSPNVPSKDVPTALPLSCYIRTLNEERNIERTLRAARLVTDDIVVVDSGSTDRTIPIAESLGARVVRQPWLGSGFQKRAGEDLCRNEWLLDIDADEVVTEALAAEIRALFAKGEPPNPIFAPPLVTISPGGIRFENSSIAYRNKLYDRRVVRAPAHKAWDQFELPSGVRPVRLTQPLDHYAYRDLGHLLEKQNRVSGVRAAETRLPPLWTVRLRVLFLFPFYFLKHYITRRYFLAGVEGFAVSMILAFGRWLRDVKRYERHRLEKRGP